MTPVDLAPHLDRLWVTADTHFGHANIVHLTRRPFRAEEQDEIMLQRWRAVVGPYDPVLHLGDLALSASPGLWRGIASLPGRPKWLVLGNHDREHRLQSILGAGFVIIPPPTFWYRGCLVGCTHEPMPPEDIGRLARRALNVHGHVHIKTAEAPDPRQINVCVELTDYRPARLRPLLDARLAALEAWPPPPAAARPG